MPNIEEELDTRLALDEPKQYKVLLHNDDYTSMEFVIEVLMHVFRKNLADSESIMLEIHQAGRGICGIYTHEIAETKVHQVKQLAKTNGFPLLATMEEV
ncbi:MAG: ATP-dependent Clp protease adaptor protein ClpS [uncultured Sulfurovum sp.]|uniref:ATP-dependent Clp protease adapter protein ClpS n=1 Tax=uncultured Sulfurovum sp. TaxID=269237 RepID=A0A6S6SUQ6_9BACT|nr:MAG: ATP-dependent Clp protease adaptor protein ClpS [uncultured Sulfurovum sp.]